MFIERDYSISAPSDFIKRVQPLIDKNSVAVEQYHRTLKTMIIGWKIQPLKG